MIGMCSRCFNDDEALLPAPCAVDPETLKGLPIGMYHCGDCGSMVLAGMAHPLLCEACVVAVIKLRAQARRENKPD